LIRLLSTAADDLHIEADRFLTADDGHCSFNDRRRELARVLTLVDTLFETGDVEIRVDPLLAKTLDEAIDRANAVHYGLHAAIFTESIRDAFTAVRRLAVGAVIVNDSTDYRLDVMPFGGTKLSGIGREGIRFASREMTETRVVCFNL